MDTNEGEGMWSGGDTDGTLTTRDQVGPSAPKAELRAEVGRPVSTPGGCVRAEGEAHAKRLWEAR